MFCPLSSFSAALRYRRFSRQQFYFPKKSPTPDYNIDWWFYFRLSDHNNYGFLEKYESSQMNFGGFPDLGRPFSISWDNQKTWFRNWWCVLPFSKRWVNTPFDLKHVFFVYLWTWIFRTLLLVFIFQHRVRIWIPRTDILT